MADLPFGAQPQSQRVRINTITGGLEFTVDNGVTWTAVGGGSVVASPDAYAVLAAPATSLVVSGLNGDAAGDYLVEIGMVFGAAVGSQHVKIQVNGADANLSARCYDFSVGQSFRAADWMFANSLVYPFAQGTTFRATGRLSARSGRERQILVIGLTTDGNNDRLDLLGRYADAATNITSFSIVSDVASGLAAGTFIRLTPLNTNA